MLEDQMLQISTQKTTKHNINKNGMRNHTSSHISSLEI